MIRQQCTSDRQSSASLQLWHLNCWSELNVVLQYLSTHFEFYLSSIDSDCQSLDILSLPSNYGEFCGAVSVIVDKNRMFKSAGRRPAMKRTHCSAIQENQEICFDTLRLPSSHEGCHSWYAQEIRGKQANWRCSLEKMTSTRSLPQFSCLSLNSELSRARDVRSHTW